MISADGIRASIRKHYAACVIESDQWYPYCFASQASLNTCGGAERMGYTRKELSGIPPESIMALGCGNPLRYAHIKAGDNVLDLGCGVGMDVFLASAKIGANGHATGIDMTTEMIGKAHTIAAHYNYTNVEFKVAEMEYLPFPDGSFDLVISNRSVSLSLDQPRVWAETLRVLRPGGQAVISDTVIMPKGFEKTARSISHWPVIPLDRDIYLRQIQDAGFAHITIMSEHHFEPVESGYDRDIGIISITIETFKPATGDVG